MDGYIDKWGDEWMVDEERVDGWVGGRRMKNG